MRMEPGMSVGVASWVPGQRVRRDAGVRTVLEWAFGTEFAQLDYDEVASVGGHGLPGRGAEARLMDQGLLGCEVDTSRGRSLPHDDAELIASLVRHSLRWDEAVRLAELSRACRVPDWMPGARLRCVPVAWRSENQYGQTARTEEVERITYRTRRGMVTRSVLCCPVTYTPTVSQLRAARSAYLDWWGWLLHMGSVLRAHDLALWRVTDAMPPMAPWRESS